MCGKLTKREFDRFLEQGLSMFYHADNVRYSIISSYLHGLVIIINIF